ncbi:MAG: site-specific DNA-methyltransferase [Limnospira sp. PMC 1291.21]|uniref:site-specific DNA-methyltransferase n=2 Tax=Limnospira TaxID=2596745 RepID=UPI0028E108F5|nr:MULTISPECIES: site-specific DNA-methyltransferase [unclassified Limnospira]MDT9177048.1 site-specific DNA-methyltransferase [Limnospira sp. PMC 1238.20]MDT9223145.1 site-specific DNA-methyltransferase [Limnospira sp. PMC 1279.21]MDT9228147.1 site-specific DNA-methyltransferase [Limnospira sp. PMC 1242.20]MDT9238561.1 site-specific DNA-methyltransferase [Limnospira sp. PMC 1261.20]MDT9247931.1 site-specific DNA-methyltransferase [Limnospira sp. PMC 1280.21]
MWGISNYKSSGEKAVENIADIQEVNRLDQHLHNSFKNKFLIEPSLTRLLVSFQANKTQPIYRWYKYKEAFSASLVQLLLAKYGLTQGKILDPFAGSGTALFAASDIGIHADGIELLPIGQNIIDTRRLLNSEFTGDDIHRLKNWINLKLWKQFEHQLTLPELKITQGAYSPETQTAIEKYLAACEQENPQIQTVLLFALLCILESISYTRKDGQYLRWDYRSGRGSGKKSLNKGNILDFDDAITQKINEIINDLEPPTQQIELFPTHKPQGKIHLYKGSCLEVMPCLPNGSYDAMITSPPYCNRYDYTRTYALELALLGVSAKELTHLRQEMLSCTVENRPKDLLAINQNWQLALSVAENQTLLQAILQFLEQQKSQGKLNNNSISRMVKGYFYEMACVIQECSRLLKPGGLLFMVNDNVRYAGISISVDMILSDLAENLGLVVENILILPGNKGNSSQQMGSHGREPLRKCVYVWQKTSINHNYL